MKLIKISTDLEMTIHEFPEGRRRDAGGVPAMSHEEQNDYLRKLIGNHCRIYEHVMPERLYTHLKMTDHPTNIPGQCVSMLIDEEGRLKPNICRKTTRNIWNGTATGSANGLSGLA